MDVAFLKPAEDTHEIKKGKEVQAGNREMIRHTCSAATTTKTMTTTTKLLLLLPGAILLKYPSLELDASQSFLDQGVFEPFFISSFNVHNFSHQHEEFAPLFASTRNRP